MKKIIILTLLLGLTACATPYSDIGVFGGVEAQQVDADHYKIMVRVNSYTKKDRFRDMTLLKAAEITRAAGKTHFLITDEKSQTSVVNMAIQGVPSRFVKPGSDVTIRILSPSQGSKVPADAYLAEDVIRDITPRLK